MALSTFVVKTKKKKAHFFECSVFWGVGLEKCFLETRSRRLCFLTLFAAGAFEPAYLIACYKERNCISSNRTRKNK